MEKEKTIHDVPVPVGIDKKMVDVAKDYVTSRLKEGFTMTDMFKRHGISSKSFYDWKREKPEYEEYINQLSETLIDTNELEAVRKMKKKILAYADKSNVTANEMKIFMDTFSYIFQADARIQSEKLGLNQSAGSTGGDSFKSLEERKASLLSRLKINTSEHVKKIREENEKGNR
ncbi:phBC6A51 family helix-turn-helix protein [Metabacillus fastidiosus]|uniref:phBC6A51 family helix-turn-helix protein n=1 Tax=Metabacillus fastidiosus TaxID=1458 RepID=UPI003D2DECF6